MKVTKRDLAVPTPTRTVVCPPGFDVRIATDVDLVKMEEMLHQWCREAGSDYTIEFAQVNFSPFGHKTVCCVFAEKDWGETVCCVLAEKDWGETVVYLQKTDRVKTVCCVFAEYR